MTRGMEDRAKRAVPVDVGIVTIKDEESRNVLPRSEGVFVGRSGPHYNLRIADAGGSRTYRACGRDTPLRLNLKRSRSTRSIAQVA